MMVDTYPDLFWSYTAVWVILALYIGVLGRRLARIERALASDQNRDDKTAQGIGARCCDSKR
jgi:CcmD family protein